MSRCKTCLQRGVSHQSCPTHTPSHSLTCMHRTLYTLSEHTESGSCPLSPSTSPIYFFCGTRKHTFVSTALVRAAREGWSCRSALDVLEDVRVWGKSVRERELESTTQSIPIESQSSGNIIGDREGVQCAFL